MLFKFNYLDKFLSEMIPQFQNVFIVGDLNLNLFAGGNAAVDHFYALLEGYYLVQVVDCALNSLIYFVLAIKVWLPNVPC